MDDERPPSDPKVRRTWLIAGLGTLVVGGGLAAATAIGGHSGAAGLASLLLGGSFACAVGSLYGLSTAGIDAVRDRPVGRRRLIAAGALAVIATFAMAAVAGMGG